MAVEVEQLANHPIVRQMREVARLNAQPETLNLTLPWVGESTVVSREGLYPLYTAEGNFHAVLLRLSSSNYGTPFRGGNFRVLENEHALELHPQHATIILDTIPIFLKEISDCRVQETLSGARSKIALADEPAFLVQTRASDLHDEQKRLSADGQLDIQEEQWFAKILTIMERFPGVGASKAREILIDLGEKPYLADYGLGPAAILAYYYPSGLTPQELSLEIIDKDFLQPFPVCSQTDPTNLPPSINKRDLTTLVRGVTRPDTKIVEDAAGNKYSVSVLARYPLMQSGVKFQVALVKVSGHDLPGFRTLRVMQTESGTKGYVRIDSICVNGIQAGDTHCDCRGQIEAELKRAQEGSPMFLVSIRDDEGRGHGEGSKGATLALQRLISRRLGIEVGNGLAASLFYDGTGLPVDARTYDATQAVLRYFGVEEIPYLVTNNEAKIKAIAQIVEIGEIVSAKVMEGLSMEANLTYLEKQLGLTGTVYTYNQI